MSHVGNMGFIRDVGTCESSQKHRRCGKKNPLIYRKTGVDRGCHICGIWVVLKRECEMMGGGDQKGVCVQHVGENSSSMARRSLLSMRERNTLDANPNPHERKLKYAKKRGEGGVTKRRGGGGGTCRDELEKHGKTV